MFRRLLGLVWHGLSCLFIVGHEDGCSRVACDMRPGPQGALTAQVPHRVPAELALEKELPTTNRPRCDRQTQVHSRREKQCTSSSPGCTAQSGSRAVPQETGCTCGAWNKDEGRATCANVDAHANGVQAIQPLQIQRHQANRSRFELCPTSCTCSCVPSMFGDASPTVAGMPIKTGCWLKAPPTKVDSHAVEERPT